MGVTIHYEGVLRDEAAREITPHFSRLEVHDEGESWETSDPDRLAMHMDVIEKRAA